MNARALRWGGILILCGGLVLGAGSAGWEPQETPPQEQAAAGSPSTAGSSTVSPGATTTIVGTPTTVTPVTVDPGAGDSTTTSTAAGLTEGAATTGPATTTAAQAGTTTSTGFAAETVARFVEAAQTVGFPVLATPDPTWDLVSLDAVKNERGAYVAASYERGQHYVTINQERADSQADVPASTPVTIRNTTGDLLDLGPIVVVHWVEGGTGLTVSTNLDREVALALIEALRPLP